MHEIDARVGGALRYDMIAESPEAIAAMKAMWNVTSHPTHSKFAELTPHTRLVLRSVIDFVPGVAAYENDIAVDFVVNGDRVRMVVTRHGMHNEESCRAASRPPTAEGAHSRRRPGPSRA